MSWDRCYPPSNRYFALTPPEPHPALDRAAEAAGPCFERLSPYGLLTLREPGSAGWVAEVTDFGDHASVTIENVSPTVLVAIVRALGETACARSTGAARAAKRSGG